MVKLFKLIRLICFIFKFMFFSMQAFEVQLEKYCREMVRLEREVHCRVRKCVCQEVAFYFRQKEKRGEHQRLRRNED